LGAELAMLVVEVMAAHHMIHFRKVSFYNILSISL